MSNTLISWNDYDEVDPPEDGNYLVVVAVSLMRNKNESIYQYLCTQKVSRFCSATGGFEHRNVLYWAELQYPTEVYEYQYYMDKDIDLNNPPSQVLGAEILPIKETEESGKEN